MHQSDRYVIDESRQHGTLQKSDCVLMYVVVVQANTPLQPSLLLELREMWSSTMGESTGRWTARHRLLRATPNVKTTTSLCPRAGRWQPTMPIQNTSSDRSAGEHRLWFLKMDVHTRLPLLGVGIGIGKSCLRLGQRTWSVHAIL